MQKLLVPAAREFTYRDGHWEKRTLALGPRSENDLQEVTGELSRQPGNYKPLVPSATLFPEQRSLRLQSP
jgi:hypothetical protein